jgi:hypothetical protein
MRLRLSHVLLTLTVLASARVASAQEFKAGDIVVSHPWSRATPTGAKVGAGYFVIENRGNSARYNDQRKDTDDYQRPIVTFPRGANDLFIEPNNLTPDKQRVIDHNRERFAKHFNYAHEFYGEQTSYDSRGDYNCGMTRVACRHQPF